MATQDKTLKEQRQVAFVNPPQADPRIIISLLGQPESTLTGAEYSTSPIGLPISTVTMPQSEDVYRTRTKLDSPNAELFRLQARYGSPQVDRLATSEKKAAENVATIPEPQITPTPIIPPSGEAAFTPQNLLRNQAEAILGRQYIPMPQIPTRPVDYSNILESLAGVQLGTSTPQTTGMTSEQVEKEYGRIDKTIDKYLNLYLGVGKEASAEKQEDFKNLLELRKQQVTEDVQRLSAITGYLHNAAAERLINAQIGFLGAKADKLDNSQMLLEMTTAQKFKFGGKGKNFATLNPDLFKKYGVDKEDLNTMALLGLKLEDAVKGQPAQMANQIMRSVGEDFLRNLALQKGIETQETSTNPFLESQIMGEIF